MLSVPATYCVLSTTIISERYQKTVVLSGGYRAGAGCEACNHTGFRGRVGIFELLPITDDIRGLILARASAGAIREAAIRAGMRTMRRDGLDKAAQGRTTPAEVLRVTQEE